MSDQLEAMTEIPDADPGTMPTKEEMCVSPWYVYEIEHTLMPAGILGEENPVRWDPDHLVWNMTLERLELGEWYRSWPVLELSAAPGLTWFYQIHGEVRMFASEYDGACSLPTS